MLNKDVKQYGKKYLFDGKDETCWNSSEGSPQWILIDLERPVELEELVIRFQGGFAGQDCWIEGSATEDSSCLHMLQKFYPEDNSSQQRFQITESPKLRLMKVIFNTSTDFYGRITIYELDIIGNDV